MERGGYVENIYIHGQTKEQAKDKVATIKTSNYITR